MIQASDEKKPPAQSGEDSFDGANERTREVSMPDAYYKSLLLDNFLSGIDEFAAEESKTSAGKSGTSSNASPTKIPGAKPGMQPWRTIPFEETTEAKDEYIKMLLHKFTSLV